MGRLCFSKNGDLDPAGCKELIELGRPGKYSLDGVLDHLASVRGIESQALLI